MKTLKKYTGVLILAMASACNSGINAPEAEKIPKEFSEFGNTRIDNYYWMNERKNPKVMSYLKEENDYTDAKFLKPTALLSKKIAAEIKSRIVEEDSTVPYLENKYYYVTRYEKGKDYEIYCRRYNSPDSTEEVLLDVNDLAEGRDYFDVGDICVSPNNKVIAYSVDTVSRRKYEIRFIDLVSGKPKSDVIPNTALGTVFANDSRTFFYVGKETNTLRASKIFRHVLGSDCSIDKEIYYEEDPTFDLDLYRSQSDEWIIITHNSTTSSEVRLIPTDRPYKDPVIFRKREKNLEYSIDHCNGTFYILTNENAKNFCIMTCDSASYNNNWKVLIPHDEKVLINGFTVFDDYLVLEEMREGLVCFEVMDLKTKERHLIDFGQEAYSAWTEDNPEHDSKVFRYGYSSFSTPPSVIEYDLATREKRVLKEQLVPGFDKSKYEVKRVMVTVRDNTKVPVTLLYKKDIDLHGNNNLLQYAYGSYGSSEEDGYWASIFSLVDRGFVFALAHVRGGSEMGRQWYEDGKLLKKMNTFNDFIDVTKYLIDSGITSPNKMYAMGGSAGGLLMGAVSNMAPELYNGIVAQVPFVDVVTTMLDESIPLTTGEYDEWGNPNEEQYYKYMLSYSPYDNVEEKDYPAMLVTTGLHDSQVQYWEPAKWVAKLRDMKSDDNPLFLHTNMKAGHSGDSGRYGHVKETAMTYTFMLWLAGIKE